MIDEPLAPGAPAPDFSLPAVNRTGVIALTDYRHRHVLLLGLFRTLY